MKPTYLIAALAAVAALTSTKTLALGSRMSRAEVLRLAGDVTARHFPGVDPIMLAVMAEVESSRNPLAQRVEPLINDASIGLMQTLISTARWLAQDMGYDAYGVPEAADLLDPVQSMYFGAAYVNWLRTYRGQARSEEWIVKSYNGGPGADNAQTRHHWAKYKAVKAELMGA